MIFRDLRMKRFHLTPIICTDFQSNLVNSFKTIKVQKFHMNVNFIIIYCKMIPCFNWNPISLRYFMLTSMAKDCSIWQMSSYWKFMKVSLNNAIVWTWVRTCWNIPHTLYSKDLNVDGDTVKVKTLRLLRNILVLKVMKGLKV